MPKSRVSAARMISPVSTIASVVIGAGHLGQRHVDGQRHHAQLVARQHHHRARRAGQMRRGIRYGRERRKPACISTALWIGAVTRAAASPARQAFDRDLDGFDHGGGVGGIGLARDAR